MLRKHKITRRAIEKIPHTPEGDKRFREYLGYITSTDTQFRRFLESEKLKRPAIYEDIQRYILECDNDRRVYRFTTSDSY